MQLTLSDNGARGATRHCPHLVLRIKITLSSISPAPHSSPHSLYTDPWETLTMQYTIWTVLCNPNPNPVLQAPVQAGWLTELTSERQPLATATQSHSTEYTEQRKGFLSDILSPITCTSFTFNSIRKMWKFWRSQQESALQRSRAGKQHVKARIICSTLEQFKRIKTLLTSPPNH